MSLLSEPAVWTKPGSAPTTQVAYAAEVHRPGQEGEEREPRRLLEWVRAR